MQQYSPTNRVFKEFISSTPAAQPGSDDVVFPSANTVERIFSGPIRFRDMLEQAIEVQAAKEEAREEIKQEIGKREEQRLLEYFTWIARIGVFVSQITKQHASNIAIESYQAQCDLRSQSLSVYFVIKGSYEDEKKFASIISSVEQIVLLKDNRIVEIFYSNATKEIDYAALKLDYPMVFDLKKLGDAFKQSSVRPAGKAQS